jgi:hypothetical protein
MTTADVFVSYAHVDNEALLDGQEGWISILQRALQKRLTQLLGRVASVWWDKRRLDGNHYFDDVIAEACRGSTVMLSVVTPRYLNSDYCRQEVEHFAEAHGLRVGHRSRLITCIKTPVEREGLFPEMAGNLGYEFFRAVEGASYFREYDTHDPALKPLFMASLEDLAQDLAKLLLDLEPRTGAGVPSGFIQKLDPTAAGEPQRVFVATTSGDVRAVREGIVRELSASGHEVLPAAPWSEDAAAFEQELGEAAAHVSLSVHLLGSGYGTTPADASASYPALQHARLKELARARSEGQPLARILWIPREVESTSEKQRLFLDEVRSDPSLGPLDELLEGSEQELKERILSKLQRLAQLSRERAHASALPRNSRRDSLSPSSAPEAVMKVYVISSDGEEAEQVTSVECLLGDRGFDVISSVELMEEESEAARELRHQELLESCDGCLILHGKTKVSWVRAQVDEVRKALGRRRHSPMRGHAVYMVPPLDPLKLRYQVQFPKLEGSSDPSHDLEPFVHQLMEEAPEPELGAAQHATL